MNRTSMLRCFQLALLAGAAAVLPQATQACGSASGQGVELGLGEPAPVAPLVVEGVVAAPIGEVWKVWSTPEGFKRLGVAKCDIDLRVGGLIRSHYNPAGELGDEGTIVNQIIAFEPERMMSFRIHTPPKGFPFMEAYKKTWSVATMTDLGDGRTHVRLATMGYDDSEESRKMRDFFQAGNTYVMKTLQAAFDAGTKKPTGPAHPAGSLDPIEVETVVPVARDQAYAWYSTSAGWKSFAGVETNIEPVPGGTFEVFFGSDAPAGQRGSEGCRVLALVPGEMFSHTWNAPPTMTHCREGGLHTWVVVRFDEVGPALTRVRLTHLGFKENAARAGEEAFGDDWMKCRAYFSQAWPKVLGAMKEAGERGHAPTGQAPGAAAASTEKAK